MSDPVVFIFFSQPSGYQSGPSTSGLWSGCFILFWSLDHRCRAQLTLSFMAISSCIGIMYFYLSGWIFCTWLLLWFCDVTKHVLLSAAMKWCFKIFKYYLYLSCCNFSVLYSLKILHRCYGIPLASDHSGSGVLHMVSELKVTRTDKRFWKLFSNAYFKENIFKTMIYRSIFK